MEQIYRFIEAETSDHAAAWFNGLCAAIATLREMPQRCPIIPEDANTRHLLYGNKPHVYRIIFRIDDPNQLVNILTVRHGARSAYKVGKRT